MFRGDTVEFDSNPTYRYVFAVKELIINDMNCGPIYLSFVIVLLTLPLSCNEFADNTTILRVPAKFQLYNPIPGRPVNPVAPVAPVAPVEPVAPVGPVINPVGPVLPVAPVRPVAPVEPVDPVGPV